MFVFRNEIIEETNDDLRYPRKQSFNSAPDYTKQIVARLSERQNLRKNNGHVKSWKASNKKPPSSFLKEF